MTKDYLVECLEGKFTSCTGCGACSNICPTDAIRLEENEKGFLISQIDEQKCINCNRCADICPQLHLKKRNPESNNFYGVYADEKTRNNSSSGGAFRIFAEKIIDIGGVVVGAAISIDNAVLHEIITTKKELLRLQKSKYVQSNTGKTFRMIKEYLENKTPVLFSGCPCQVAGLYAYLNKEYSDLYTIDILCSGVPSAKMLRDYFNESMHGSKVVFYDFCSKVNGWDGKNLTVVLENGAQLNTKIFGDIRNNSYEEAFHNTLSQNTVCEKCFYRTASRQGDITIGDFWGVENYFPDIDYKNGVSVIFVNNEKGIKLFGMSKKSMAWVAKTSIKAIEKYNPLEPNQVNPITKERFNLLYPSHNFTESVEQSLYNKYDIGLVGNYNGLNYGAELCYWALYRYLTDNHISVLMIGPPATAPYFPLKGAVPSLFANNPYPSYALSDIYDSKKEMVELNLKCKSFIVGSDQVFNYDMYNSMGKIYTLDWVQDNHPKIAYGASFGYNYFTGKEYDRAEMMYGLQKFDYISTREGSGIYLLKDIFGVNIEEKKVDSVLDPVFLIDKTVYKKTFVSEHSQDSRYLFVYILDSTSEKERELKKCSRKLDIDLRIIVDADINNKKQFQNIDMQIGASIEEWLSGIFYSEYVITDSFHGMCFAIIFNKPFLVIVNHARGAERFDALLSKLGLLERKIEGISEKQPIDDLLLKPIDYEKVNQIIDAEIDRSETWLFDVLKLSSRKLKSFSTADILKNELQGFDKAEVDKLQKEINVLNDRLIYLENTALVVDNKKLHDAWVSFFRIGIKNTVVCYLKKLFRRGN